MSDKMINDRLHHAVSPNDLARALQAIEDWSRAVRKVLHYLPRDFTLYVPVVDREEDTDSTSSDSEGASNPMFLGCPAVTVYRYPFGDPRLTGCPPAIVYDPGDDPRYEGCPAPMKEQPSDPRYEGCPPPR